MATVSVRGWIASNDRHSRNGRDSFFLGRHSEVRLSESGRRTIYQARISGATLYRYRRCLARDHWWSIAHHWLPDTVDCDSIHHRNGSGDGFDKNSVVPRHVAIAVATRAPANWFLGGTA